MPESAQALVEFQAKFAWALVPARAESMRAPEATPKDASRWLGNRRTAARCGPSQVAAQLGWVVRSPLDVTMSPLPQTEVVTRDEDELEELSWALPGHDLWRREDGFMALPKPNWLRLYQAKFGRSWESIFVPNGQGTYEWHLGWTMTIPKGYSMLVIGHESSALGVPMGVLSEPVIEKLNEGHGQAIAVRPLAETTIRRGDPLARLVLLHPHSLMRVGSSGGLVSASHSQMLPNGDL